MKIGLFLDNELMIEYPNTGEGYREALGDARMAFDDSGLPHEIKFFQGGVGE